MVMANAYDDVEKSQVRMEGDGKDMIGSITQVRFFGSRDRPDLPHANLTRLDPGRVSLAHFHNVDQFQLVVAGEGSLGRHKLAPYCVHFSRA